MAANSRDVHLLMKTLIGVSCVKKAYAYALIKGISVWNSEKGYPDKKQKVQIGSIRSADGIGLCLFNPKFLEEHPLFKRYNVYREGRGQYGFELKSDAERANDSAQKLRNERVNVKAKAFGGIYFLKSFLAQSLSGKILKKLLPQDKYEELLALMATIITCGSDNLESGVASYVRDHALFNIVDCTKDTLLDLFVYLEQHDIGARLFSEKLKEQKELKVSALPLTPLVFDCTYNKKPETEQKAYFKNREQDCINNASRSLTLLDKNTYELYDTICLKGETDLYTLVNSVKEQVSLAQDAQNLGFVLNKTNIGLLDLNYLLDSGVKFVVSYDFTQSKRLTALVLEHIADLRSANNCTIVSFGSEGKSLPARTLGLKSVDFTWQYSKDKASILSQQSQKCKACLKAHILYDIVIFNEIMSKLYYLVGEINEKYHLSGHKIKPEILSQYSSVFENGLLKYDAKSDGYILDYPQVEHYASVKATSVLVTNFYDDVKELVQSLRYKDYLVSSFVSLEAKLDKNTQLPVKTCEETGKGSKLFVLGLTLELVDKITASFKDYNKDRLGANKVLLVNNSVQETLKELDSLKMVYDKYSGKFHLEHKDVDKIKGYYEAGGIALPTDKMETLNA